MNYLASYFLPADGRELMRVRSRRAGDALETAHKLALQKLGR